MPLSKKHKHQLIDIGTNLIPLQENIIPILDKAKIEHWNIDLRGSATAMWFNTIEYTDSYNLVDKLLSVLIETFDKNLLLKEIKEEIAKQSIPTLIQHLKSIMVGRQCVLFLGPYTFNCLDNLQISSFNNYLSRQLAGKLSANDIFYDKNEIDNLSYIIDRYETHQKFVMGDTEKVAKDIYENGSILDMLYRRLDRFTFPLIINTNPDTILETLFGEAKYIHRRYDMTNTLQEGIPEDYPSKTIVYNIFGSFKNPYSILFTEKEAVEFTKKTYEKTPPIPDEIKSIIAKSYGLFLGFDFKNWHLKILFDVLDLKNKPGNYSISDTHTNILEFNKEYYERQYNMTFLNDDLITFLTLLLK
jgi:hypothetical protein